MRLLLKHWWWVLIAVPVFIGLARLRFDVDVLDLLPRDQPSVQGLKLYQQYFANARELIITLRSEDAERTEQLAASLAARLRGQSNLVTSVSSLSFLCGSWFDLNLSSWAKGMC